MNKNEIAEKILRGLERQKFADWYTDGEFERWICADQVEGGPTRQDVLDSIKQIFKL